jgi:hypothetical protein
MTKKVNLGILFALSVICAVLAQEPPTPTPSPSPSPEQTPSASPARNVRLSFVPPPMDGTISLGIFDANKKLVRVLHRDAKIDDFTIDSDSLNTTWDGKNDAGEDLPPGKYRARGYTIARLKVEPLGKAAAPPPSETADHVSVKLAPNPLMSGPPPIVDLTVGFDDKGSVLKTTDGLPLCTVSPAPNLARVLITKDSEKSVIIWQDDGASVEQVRLSNIDKMMAFDCGDFDLK